MKQTTQIGATVEEAISLALQKLGHTREQVDVEVLQEGKKGFLGFGSRNAEVRVTVKEIVQQQVNEQSIEQVVSVLQVLWFLILDQLFQLLDLFLIVLLTSSFKSK